jgi:hypothetical protein
VASGVAIGITYSAVVRIAGGIGGVVSRISGAFYGDSWGGSCGYCCYNYYRGYSCCRGYYGGCWWDGA